MFVKFRTASAEADALITDEVNMGTDRRRHVEVTGTAESEVAGRAIAQEILNLLTENKDVHWRVVFEYKPYTKITHGGRQTGYHIYGRFSYR